MMAFRIAIVLGMMVFLFFTGVPMAVHYLDVIKNFWF